MNYSTAIFLISDQARAINITYEEGDDAPKTMFKTLDPDIKIDDYVAVPTETRHHMTVCKVVEVDVEPDLESGKTMSWVVGVVDRADFDKIKSHEGDAIARIKSAEKTRKRKELRDALLADVGSDLEKLPIYSQAEASNEKA